MAFSALRCISGMLPRKTELRQQPGQTSFFGTAIGTTRIAAPAIAAFPTRSCPAANVEARCEGTVFELPSIAVFAAWAFPTTAGTKTSFSLPRSEAAAVRSS
jgi:hypothetical protein